MCIRERDICSKILVWYNFKLSATYVECNIFDNGEHCSLMTVWNILQEAEQILEKIDHLHQEFARRAAVGNSHHNKRLMFSGDYKAVTPCWLWIISPVTLVQWERLISSTAAFFVDSSGRWLFLCQRNSQEHFFSTNVHPLSISKFMFSAWTFHHTVEETFLAYLKFHFVRYVRQPCNSTSERFSKVPFSDTDTCIRT